MSRLWSSAARSAFGLQALDCVLADVSRYETPPQRWSPITRITAWYRGSDAMVLNGGYCAICANSMAFDKRGNLYVLQYDGNLFRVGRDRSATPDSAHQSVMCAQYTAGERTTVLTGLMNPTSVAVGPDGAPYISNRGSFPATGQVIRYEPPPR